MPLRRFNKGKVLDYALKKENNNYDVIRLAAAVLVIVFHSVYLFKGDDVSSNTFGMHIWAGLGGFAVGLFFFLSGIFITASFLRHNNIIEFVIHRVCRIWPALVVCILFTTIVIGPLVSTLPIRSYFVNQQTRDYLLHGITLYNIRYELPGVFKNNHYPGAVNGSLWTLPNEIKCYVLIGMLGVLGLLKKPAIAIPVYMLLLTLYYLNFHQAKFYLSNQFPYFVFGSLAFLLRRYVILNVGVLVLLFIVSLLFTNQLVVYITLFYAAILIGSSKTVLKAKLPGDYSYGVYIYGFIVQQIIAQYLPDTTRLASIFYTLPLVFLLAILSWHFIELPMVAKARKYVSGKA